MGVKGAMPVGIRGRSILPRVRNAGKGVTAAAAGAGDPVKAAAPGTCLVFERSTRKREAPSADLDRSRTIQR